MTQLGSEASEILGKKAFAHIATLNEEGAPHSTPVWIEADGDDVLINTAKGRLKYKHLDSDPRVSISITDPDDPYTPLLIQGTVSEMTTDGAHDQIERLSDKYFGKPYPFHQPGEERVVVRIRPQKVSVGQ